MNGESGHASLLHLIPQATEPQTGADAPQLCGVDEAGRGCLAGPVIAAAVIFPPHFDFSRLPGLTDSKKLSAKQRAVLEPLIRSAAVTFALGSASAAEIDAVNILNASLRAMSRAVHGVLHRRGQGLPPLELCLDGNQTIPPPQWLLALKRPLHPLPAQKALVGADALVPAVSAASILAKNMRDRLLVAADARHPGYGFAEHKGYGTAAHLAALQQLGPCSLHRLTFAGVSPRPQQLTLF